MRTLFGICLGAVLTIGLAFLHDNNVVPDPANPSLADQKSVNWDVFGAGGHDMTGEIGVLWRRSTGGNGPPGKAGSRRRSCTWTHMCGSSPLPPPRAPICNASASFKPAPVPDSFPSFPAGKTRRIVVPGSGLEPLHREAQASETCVSTNSTTRAKGGRAKDTSAPPGARKLIATR